FQTAHRTQAYNRFINKTKALQASIEFRSENVDYFGKRLNQLWNIERKVLASGKQAIKDVVATGFAVPFGSSAFLLDCFTRSIEESFLKVGQNNEYATVCKEVLTRIVGPSRVFPQKIRL